MRTLAVLLLLASTVETQPRPAFWLNGPRGMVTGTVLLQARTTDEKVAWVRWELSDWAKTTPQPFDLSLDLGGVPNERSVRAVAMDADRVPLYRQELRLNSGGRGFDLDIVQPSPDRPVFGATPVVVRVGAPGDDQIDTVVLDDGGGHEIALQGSGEIFRTVLQVPQSPFPIVARARTRRGREIERTIFLNARGFMSNAAVCVVQQTVGVYRRGQPVEGLTTSDFEVRDSSGTCPIRAVEFVKNTPIAVGLAVDCSISLAHSRPFLKTATSQFLDELFDGDDVGFLVGFGPRVSKVRGWTNDREDLKTGISDLPEWTVPGTQLYDAVISSLYELQGSQGARALILFTDGQDYDGDASLENALAYARQSGVKIYALAVPSLIPGVPADGDKLEEIAPLVSVLEMLSSATGGRTYLVKNVEDLPKIFAAVGRDLRSQYLVSFVSHARRKNVFHPVTVKARSGDVQTSAGFFF